MFLKDALKNWISFQFHPPENRNDILQQIIWFNAYILIQKKNLLFKAPNRKKCYVYNRAVKVNALTHPINLKKFTSLKNN